MDAGIDIKISLNEYTINRCSSLDVIYTHGAVINMATFVVADTMNEVFSKIKAKDNVKIDFGVLDGEMSQFTGTIYKVTSHINQNAINVTVLCEAKKLSETVLTESYNDETSVNIIKRIVEQAGFSIGEVSIPDVTIPHIVFDNITISSAINKIYKTLEGLGNNLEGQDFFIHENKFYAGNITINGNTPTIETGINIIHHKFINNGYAEIECSIIPKLCSGMKFTLNDQTRKISGNYKAEYVHHSINQGKARTLVGYYYE